MRARRSLAPSQAWVSGAGSSGIHGFGAILPNRCSAPSISLRAVDASPISPSINTRSSDGTTVPAAVIWREFATTLNPPARNPLVKPSPIQPAALRQEECSLSRGDWRYCRTSDRLKVLAVFKAPDRNLLAVISPNLTHSYCSEDGEARKKRTREQLWGYPTDSRPRPLAASGERTASLASLNPPDESNASPESSRLAQSCSWVDRSKFLALLPPPAGGLISIFPVAERSMRPSRFC